MVGPDTCTCSSQWCQLYNGSKRTSGNMDKANTMAGICYKLLAALFIANGSIHLIFDSELLEMSDKRRRRKTGRWCGVEMPASRPRYLHGWTL
ncbi:hypothetical protein EJ02DRAFT_160912 [Clathrospora elynae]|uniref:Uncharacterized protein n=1 Tax=Clathrospora elynae TaxID=706981 RepID=A0A6A5T0S1_9PLEO|nr:hypothetical protein EJ02DRAFT_160912 [Clathrospora elynae]